MDCSEHNRILAADVTRVEAVGDGGVAGTADDSTSVGEDGDFLRGVSSGGFLWVKIQAKHEAIEVNLSGFLQPGGKFFEAEEE